LTRYLDTSLLVAALTNEARTSEVQAWMATWEEDGFASSQWVATEVSSALAIKLRSGRIDSAGRAIALATFTRMFSATFDVLVIADSHFRAATRYVDQFALGLRSGDALHLAIAAAHGVTVCTLDQRTAAAGLGLGVSTELV
jgi:predicted nucleic acid-binding protein